MLDGNVRYSPLKQYVCRAGGIRLSIHRSMRDQLVEWAVEEFPDDAPQDKVASVLAARLRIRARKQYGSVILTILIGVMIQLVVNAIVDWISRSRANRVLMAAWLEESRAKKAQDI